MDAISSTVRLSVVSAAVAVVLLLASQHGGVHGLKCWQCSNWDNRTNCVESKLGMGKSIEQCNQELKNSKAVCLTELMFECQAMVFKDSEDLVGNGGELQKRWAKFGCVYLPLEDVEPYKSHSKCYWERFRGGHDILHLTSGFQVIGRSMIKKQCHCNTDLCNTLEAPECNPPTCGPDCQQVSRDECVTPNMSSSEEQFQEGCACEPKRENSTTERAWIDCDIDKNRFEPSIVGPLTYRHKPGEIQVRAAGSNLAASLVCVTGGAVVLLVVNFRGVNI